MMFPGLKPELVLAEADVEVNALGKTRASANNTQTTVLRAARPRMARLGTLILILNRLKVVIETLR